jgi:hypothetical protein
MGHPTLGWALKGCCHYVAFFVLHRAGTFGLVNREESPGNCPELSSVRPAEHIFQFVPCLVSAISFQGDQATGPSRLRATDPFR